MKWLIFLSQLPSTPSSLRVNVWRKLRAAGALGLQNGVWLLPDEPERAKFLEDLLGLVQSEGAGGQIFSAVLLKETYEQEILARFRADRDEEYSEVLERCQEFLAEIERESGRQKFTFAELEENEQDLHRLETWLERVSKRDFTGGTLSGQAAETLERCQAAFETFSTEVYHRQAAASLPSTGLDTDPDVPGRD